MISLSFEKWHGCRNDFLVIHGSPQENRYIHSSLIRQAPQLCSKKGDGIGADGILYVRKAPEGYQVTVINADGSLAQNCGNGLRCVAASLWHANPPQEGELSHLTLQVEHTSMHLQLLGKQESDMRYHIMAEMPAPQLEGAVSGALETQLRSLCPSPSIRIDRIEAASVGNAHLLVFLSQGSPAQVEAWGHNLRASSLLTTHNVHFLWENPTDTRPIPGGGQVGETYGMQSWERGVGASPACGSGACAAGSSILDQGFLSRSDWVALDTPGGRLWVQQRDPQGEIRLVGPARFVYRGTFFL